MIDLIIPEFIFKLVDKGKKLVFDGLILLVRDVIAYSGSKMTNNVAFKLQFLLLRQSPASEKRILK